MNPLAPALSPSSARFVPAFLALPALLVLAGCESPSTSTTPQLTVQASRSASMGAADTSAPSRTFTLRYINASSQAAIQPHLPPLLDALARHGFEPARRDQTPDAIVWIAAIQNFHQQVQAGSMQGPPVTGSTDSVRYKNTAAMFGRYKQLMHDDRYGAGEMILGPEGEVIMTGDLGSSAADDVDLTPTVPTRTVLRQRNVLAIWATDTAPPQSADDSGELWRVEVMSDLATDATPPSFSTLVDTAIQNLARNTDGLQSVPLPE